MDEMVSIIIPVYNTAPALLQRAVESALIQRFLLEVLIVDDGSDLETAKCVANLSMIGNGRVRVFAKENGGVSSARNYAMKFVRGRYIAFLDADDVLAPGFCEEATSFLESNKEVDAIFGAMRLLFPNGNSKVLGNPEIGNEIKVFGDKEILSIKGSIFNGRALEAIDLCPAMYVSQCAVLYRASVVGSIRFDERLKISEDRIFNYSVLSNCRNVALTGKIWYSYIRNQGSSSQRFRPNAKQELLDTANAISALDDGDIAISNDLNIGIIECFQQTLGFSILHDEFKRTSSVSRRAYVKCLMQEPVYVSSFNVAHVIKFRQKIVQLFFKWQMPGMIVLTMSAIRFASEVKHRFRCSVPV